MAIEIKPKCGFTFREDGKLRYDVKTNAEDGKRGKRSAYDPRKFFEHCEIWSFADGVDYEALKKQLVRELEHMIETPRNTFRVREAKTGEVLWDATKGGSNAKPRFVALARHASRDACETSAKLVREEFEKKQRDFEKLQREHDRKQRELEAAREDARVHHERQLKKFDKDLRDFAHKEKIEHENHAKRLVTLDDQHRTEADEQRRQRREGRRAGLAEEETARRIARGAVALRLDLGVGLGLAAPLPARGANPQAT